MDRVFNVQQINLSKKNKSQKKNNKAKNSKSAMENHLSCPICSNLLFLKKCNLALYDDDAAHGGLAMYIAYDLLFCNKCNLYYIEQYEVNTLNLYLQIHYRGLKPSLKYHEKYKKYLEVQKEMLYNESLNKRLYSEFTFALGAKIFHKDKLDYYGNSHGVVTKFDGIYMTVKFSNNNIVNLEVSFELINKYCFFDKNIRKQMLIIAKRNSITKKKREEDLKNIKNLNWTNGKKPYEINICYGVVGCYRKDSHKIENVIAKVLTLDKAKVVTINVSYCSECNKYFIHHESYNSYCDSYGPLVLRPIRYHNLKTYYDEDDIFQNLYSQSLLSFYGYKADNKSTDKTRQMKLVSIIEFKLMDKIDIQKHLEMLIDLLKNTPTNFEANKRRTRDLLFLNNYHIERQREIFGVIVDRAKNFFM